MMGIEEIEGYGWANNISGPYLAHLHKLRENTSKITETNLMPFFTDHSVKHSDRVAKIIGCLLVDNLQNEEKKLSEKEIFILLSAVLLHDIGLFVPKAIGIEKPVTEYCQEDYIAIRKNHGETSSSIIRLGTSSQEKYGIDLLLSTYPKFQPIIAKICELHQSDKNYNQSEELPFEGSKIRIGLLIGLLRLADQLDCDSNRIQISALKRFSIPCESIIHWMACHYVDSVEIENGLITIYISFPRVINGPLGFYLGDELIKKIKAEYSKCEKVLWKNAIKVKPPDNVNETPIEYDYGKQSVPEDCLELIRDKLANVPSDSVKVSTSVRGGKKQILDFMSFWGFVGNPFLDHPLAFGNSDFVETPFIEKVLMEIQQHLEGSTGDLKLLIGQRGLGKTTLFKSIESKFQSKYSVRVIDVSSAVINVRTAADLQKVIIGSISADLRPDDKEVDAEKIIETASMGKKKIICIDSLDRLPSDNIQIIIDFFKTAQKFLTDLRSHAVVIISCAEEWGRLFQSKELQYLGLKNVWKMESFSTDQIESMLSKRIKSSGNEYQNVFKESSSAAINTLSNGNPRDVLGYAEVICRVAAEKDIKPITGEFIRTNFKKEFDASLEQLIQELYKKDEDIKKGFNLMYIYYLEMERRNLIVAEGWQYFGEMIQDYLLRDRIPPVFIGPLGVVSRYDNKIINGKNIPILKPKHEVSKLFSSLKSKGYSNSSFISFYSANPQKIEDEDNAELLQIKSGLLTGEDIEHLDKANSIFFQISKGNKAPFQIVISSWDCIEELIIAILVKNSKFNYPKYEEKKQDAYYLDKYGIPRRKGRGGLVLAECAEGLIIDFKVLLRKRNRFMFSFTGMKWILDTRNNIERGGSHYLDRYGKKEVDICLKHLDPVYRELLAIYNEFNHDKSR